LYRFPDNCDELMSVNFYFGVLDIFSQRQTNDRKLHSRAANISWLFLLGLRFEDNSGYHRYCSDQF
jgi:hypothetical protein